MTGPLGRLRGLSRSGRRRLAVGVLVLVLAAAGVAAVPILRPGLTAGTAVVVPPPDPPAVGDCLVSALPDSFNVNNAAQGPDPFSQLVFAPCNGTRYGEVVSVTTTAGPSTDAVTPDQTDTCTQSANRYAGIPALTQTYWGPVVFLSAFTIRPSARQRAGGQHWLACVGYIPSDNPHAPTLQLAGSFHDVYTAGVDRNRLGVCPTDDKWRGGAPAGCVAPHTVEVFGVAQINSTVARADLQQTCEQLIRASTGLPDPTSGGQLTIGLRATDPDGYVLTDSQLPSSSFVACGIQSGKRGLSGSLLAWGNHPLPWS